MARPHQCDHRIRELGDLTEKSLHLNLLMQAH